MVKAERKPNDAEFEQALALLISATKKKKRTVPLTRIADALFTARNQLGSISKVAAAIGISGKMLGQFARVNDLQGNVRQMVESRLIDSIDAVVHLAQFDKVNQQTAATALAGGHLDTKDLRAILELYKTAPNRSLTEIIDQVRSSKTRRQYVIEFVVRGSFDEAKIRERLKRYIDSSDIEQVLVDGSLGRVVLNEDGYKELRARARILRLGVKELATLATMQSD